jgi:hypothetical protein
MPWTGIGLLMEVDPDREEARVIVLCRESEAAISNLSGSFIVACAKIGEARPEKDIIISGIQFHCALEVTKRIIPARLSSIDISVQLKDSRVVWQSA